VRESEDAYKAEWAATTGDGHKDIARAAELAGLGNANQRLNRAVSDLVADELSGIRRRLTVLDIGAGTGSTSAALLERVPEIAERATFHLVDPAENALAEAKENLGRLGLVVGRTMHLHAAKDLEVLELLGPARVDLILANAAIHHHAYLQPALQVMYGVLRPRGLVCIGDWHCTLWHAPIRVWHLLNSLEWKGKEKELREFEHVFGLSGNLEEPNPKLRRANEEIAGFWRSYAESKAKHTPPFFILEGHRSPEDYAQGLERAGFVVDHEPIPLSLQSWLLCVMTARKR